MKFEKVSEYKLRITLSTDELPGSESDLDNFMSDPSFARESILDFLQKAEEEVNFHVGNSKVRVDAISDINGNYTFTVTKLIPKNKKISKVKPVKVPAKNDANYIVYSFTDLEQFISLCSFLKAQKISSIRSFSKESELYKLKDNYYLIFSEINNNYKYIAQVYSLAPEFGTYVTSNPITCTMIKEKGTLIIKNNAVQICQKNFKN